MHILRKELIPISSVFIFLKLEDLCTYVVDYVLYNEMQKQYRNFFPDVLLRVEISVKL